IANEFYRIIPASDGLEIVDLRHQVTLRLGFEDDGDRGDEYNHDPVPGSQPITHPVACLVQKIENGPVRSRAVVAMIYDVPISLTADRKARDARTEPLRIELTATLYRGLDRINIEVIVENRSRDHRLRVALRSPVVAESAVHDTSFGVIHRTLSASEPPGTE